eukprot:TRINITY_DN694_c0_g1_i10.p3 TRINITY_DN694_c0_g1~~TRINITY_DN694_c0_g1_i10.p3  ORF type:complete len:101 (+),score=16.72 TRINITY_DN694_c0_g1_i10:479-781(+)
MFSLRIPAAIRILDVLRIQGNSPDSRSFGVPLSRRRSLPPRTSPCPSLDDLSTVDHLENTPHLSTPLDKAWSHAARDPMFFRIPAAIRILDVLRIQGNSP